MPAVSLPFTFNFFHGQAQSLRSRGMRMSSSGLNRVDLCVVYRPSAKKCMVFVAADFGLCLGSRRLKNAATGNRALNSSRWKRTRFLAGSGTRHLHTLRITHSTDETHTVSESGGEHPRVMEAFLGRRPVGDVRATNSQERAAEVPGPAKEFIA